MKKLITLALTLVLALSLAACAGSQRESAVKDIYAEQGGEITLPEGMDTSRRFNTQLEGDTMYAEFSHIQLRNTGYFSPAGDTITLTSYATTDSPGLLEYKAGLWELTDDNKAQYVNGCTLYFTTGGDCYSGTFSGLDPAKRYKITISYDSASYFITGAMKVQGISNGEMLSDDGSEAVES